jgi:hypothetical protein
MGTWVYDRCATVDREVAARFQSINTWERVYHVNTQSCDSNFITFIGAFTCAAIDG